MDALKEVENDIEKMFNLLKGSFVHLFLLYI